MLTPEMYSKVSFQSMTAAFLVSITFAIDHTMFLSMLCGAKERGHELT